MVKFPDITITSLETITAFTIGAGEYWFTLDELQSASIEQSQETTDITGKQGRKLSTLKRNKSVTVSGDNGLVSGGLYEAQTGSSFEDKLTEVLWTDYLYTSDNSAETSYKAVGTVGAEIEGLYVRNSDGTLGDLMTQGDEVGDGVFTYDPDTKLLEFSDIADNTEIVVYYKRQISAYVLVNSSETFSEKAQLYIDAMGEDKCGNVYRVQFYFPKADIDGNFTFDMGTDQTVHSFSAEALSGACGVDNQFFTYTVFGVDTEDADEDGGDDGDGSGSGTGDDGDDGGNGGSGNTGDGGNGGDGNDGGDTEPDDEQP